MRSKLAPPADIDAYIATFPADIRARLESVRAVIRKAGPDARERISYQIPCFALCGNLVYFAAFKNHIGFYPGASAVKKFARKLASYDFAKGSVQFPHDRPIPFALIADIVAFRIKENLDRMAAKSDTRSRTAARGTRRRRAAS